MAGGGSNFSHEVWDRFLARHVDSEGRLDYAGLAEDRADLDEYRAALAESSPDSDPGRFRTVDARLAYWINAYNASVIGLVLEHYPITSVQDVKAPWLFRFLPSGAGFFVFQRVVLGGKRTSLYGLENALIRKRFEDPRIHFALNCASASCPRLPAEAFTEARLQAQLEREAEAFLSEKRNVEVDLAGERIVLSSIFDWYEGDFKRGAANNPPGARPSLRAYLEASVSDRVRADLRACAACQIEFRTYDWSLNDRREVEGAGRGARK